MEHPFTFHDVDDESRRGEPDGQMSLFVVTLHFTDDLVSFTHQTRQAVRLGLHCDDEDLLQ